MVRSTAQIRLDISMIAIMEYPERRMSIMAIRNRDGGDANTYLGSFEVCPQPGAQMTGVAAGGFVYCFAVAMSLSEAKKKMMESLEKDKYRIITTEYVEQYDTLEWGTAEEKLEYDGYANQARQSNGIVYGPFYTYETSD